jgi:hypothetical protein
VGAKKSPVTIKRIVADWMSGIAKRKPAGMGPVAPETQHQCNGGAPEKKTSVAKTGLI